MRAQKGHHDSEGDAFIAIHEGVRFGDADAIQSGQLFQRRVRLIRQPVPGPIERAFKERYIANARSASVNGYETFVPGADEMRRHPRPFTGAQAYFARSR